MREESSALKIVMFCITYRCRRAFMKSALGAFKARSNSGNVLRTAGFKLELLIIYILAKY